MKAQIFSAVYTIIFAAIILTIIFTASEVLNNWQKQALLTIDARSLEAMLTLVDNFDNYGLKYNTSSAVNLSISAEKITLSAENYNISVINSFNLPDKDLKNINNVMFRKNSGKWVIE